jgi:hypothetical protein
VVKLWHRRLAGGIFEQTQASNSAFIQLPRDAKASNHQSAIDQEMDKRMPVSGHPLVAESDLNSRN